MSFPEEFTLPRLSLERVREAHLPLWEELFNDDKVLQTLGGNRPDGWVKANLENQVEHWEVLGFGLWILRNPPDQDFIGRGGLQALELDGEVCVEVSYALLPTYWGLGLATALAQFSVETARQLLNIDSLVALTLPDNLASQRVAEKAGFVYEREVVHADLPHSLFRLPLVKPDR